MTLETHSCKIPAWALDYLFNAGDGGLADEDLALVRAWEGKWGGSIWISASGGPYFSDRPAFGPPCDVVDREVLVRKDD